MGRFINNPVFLATLLLYIICFFLSCLSVSILVLYSDIPLLRCRDCAVEVHADCYGTKETTTIDNVSIDLDTSFIGEAVTTTSPTDTVVSTSPELETAVLGWQCEQCAVGQRDSVCQLCPFLGGIHEGL